MNKEQYKFICDWQNKIFTEAKMSTEERGQIKAEKLNWREFMRSHDSSFTKRGYKYERIILFTAYN